MNKCSYQVTEQDILEASESDRQPVNQPDNKLQHIRPNEQPKISYDNLTIRNLWSDNRLSISYDVLRFKSLTQFQ